MVDVRMERPTAIAATLVEQIRLGSEIESGLAEALNEAYPNDQARGCADGDILGVFTGPRPL